MTCFLMINQRNNSLLLEGGDNDNGKQLHPTDDGKWEIEKKKPLQSSAAQKSSVAPAVSIG